MRRKIAALVLLAALAASPFAAAQKADPPAVSGTRIGLAPPPGFEPSEEFDGFVDRRAGVSIAVTELPQSSFVSLRGGLAQSDIWAKRGMTLVKMHRLEGFPYEHVLAQARRTQLAAPIDVWTLVVGQRDLTATVVVNVRQAPTPGMSPEQVMKMLSGVRIVAAPPDPAARLPFAVDPPPRFTHRRTVAGRQLVLKESPPPPAGSSDDITAWISMVPRAPAKAEQRELFARQHFFSQKTPQVLLLDTPRATTVAGLPALEMTGDGRSPTGEQRRVFVTIVFGAKASYIVQAMAPERLLNASLGDLRKLASSLKPK